MSIFGRIRQHLLGGVSQVRDRQAYHVLFADVGLDRPIVFAKTSLETVSVQLPDGSTVQAYRARPLAAPY